MRSTTPFIVLAGLSALASGCKPRDADSKLDAAPEDRRIMGEAAAYPAVELDHNALQGSMAARRRVGWQILGRILEPTPLKLADRIDGEATAKTVPRWQTWLDAREFEALFVELYERLGKSGRQAKKPFSKEAIDHALNELPNKEIPGWDEERFTKRLGQIKQPEDVHGLSGRGGTLFSPELVRHYLENYREILDCLPKLKELSPLAEMPKPEVLTPCFKSEFPKGAAAIKTNWINAAPTKGVARFKTDDQGLASAWESGEWAKQEGEGAKPSPQEIYTLKLANGASFRLGALHVMTKELRDWMWVTIWWSEARDLDFGEDRPPEIRDNPGLNVAWRNYKMCAVSSFEEGDADPGRELENEFPDLAKTLRASHARTGPYTHCSNPYIERGKGNARTNCIGCHQHAGADLDTDEIFLDDPSDPGNDARRALYPHASRSLVRKNFPGDYLWSFSHGPDYFASALRARAAEIDSYDGN